MQILISIHSITYVGRYLCGRALTITCITKVLFHGWYEIAHYGRGYTFWCLQVIGVDVIYMHLSPCPYRYLVIIGEVSIQVKVRYIFNDIKPSLCKTSKHTLLSRVHILITVIMIRHHWLSMAYQIAQHLTDYHLDSPTCGRVIIISSVLTCQPYVFKILGYH